MQQMSENFVDTFGFSDAAFNEDGSEDNGKDDMHRLTNVLASEDDSSASDANKRAQGIFETICEQRFTSFPGGFEDDLADDMNDQEDEDPWADKTKEISFSSSGATVDKDSNLTNNSTSSFKVPNNSSDEDEDGLGSPKKENSMEIDDDDEGKYFHIYFCRFFVNFVDFCQS